MSDDPKPSNIVPFGKYKGRLLEEVLIEDPSYIEWLTGQDWFRTKFTVLHQVIINRGAEPEETPEHNAMQVKFLDEDFCWRFLRCLAPDLAEDFAMDVAFEERGVDVVFYTSITWKELPARLKQRQRRAVRWDLQRPGRERRAVRPDLRDRGNPRGVRARARLGRPMFHGMFHGKRRALCPIRESFLALCMRCAKVRRPTCGKAGRLG